MFAVHRSHSKGSARKCGMTPRVFEHLFSRIQKEKELRRDEKPKFTCKCSFLEIYNEQILDLLDPSFSNLQTCNHEPSELIQWKVTPRTVSRFKFPQIKSHSWHNAWRKKRKYELGRQPANTKLSSNKTVRRIRVRGGNVKWRDLRLDTGNYSWGSKAVTRKTRILDVVYNASNNELVRTQTLVKSAIVQVDAAPFRQWYLQHYGIDIGRKKKSAANKETTEEGETTVEEAKKSNHVQRKIEKRQVDHKLDSHIEEQFGGGRLLACISSRPGQCGRADGYILKGKELEFYMKKIQRKKGKGVAA